MSIAPTDCIWCLNAVAADGGAVLIRALEPQTGVALMAARRGSGSRLFSGSERLTQALGVIGRDAGATPGHAVPAVGPPSCAEDTAWPSDWHFTAKDVLWRFGLAGSPDRSRPIGERHPNGRRPTPSPMHRANRPALDASRVPGSLAAVERLKL
jgi:DNA-3-methyladenine glycosylase